MDLPENEKGKRKRVKQKEKVKIHYRKRMKLRHRPSRWIRFKKYFSKHRKMITVSIVLVAGLIIAMTSVFLMIKQKSDKHQDMMEKKFTTPAS